MYTVTAANGIALYKGSNLNVAFMFKNSNPGSTISKGA